jgi:hypothetical protein
VSSLALTIVEAAQLSQTSLIIKLQPSSLTLQYAVTVLIAAIH